MKTCQLPIYLDSYRLTQEVFRCTIKFPKEFKFSLGQSLNESALDLCCQVSKASHTQSKEAILEQVLTLCDRIKIQLRLSADFKILSCQQQATFASLLEKITAQAMAWLKSERRKQPVP